MYQSITYIHDCLRDHVCVARPRIVTNGRKLQSAAISCIDRAHMPECQRHVQPLLRDLIVWSTAVDLKVRKLKVSINHVHTWLSKRKCVQQDLVMWTTPADLWMRYSNVGHIDGAHTRVSKTCVHSKTSYCDWRPKTSECGIWQYQSITYIHDCPRDRVRVARPRIVNDARRPQNAVIKCIDGAHTWSSVYKPCVYSKTSYCDRRP